MAASGKTPIALFKNLKYTIDDVAVQLSHAYSVRGRARSGYYRVAFLLLASMVEATLHAVITQMCANDPELIKKVRRMKQSKGTTTLVKLPKKEIGTDKELWICEIDREKIDKLSTFKGMIDISLEMGIITKRLYNSLDKIRIQRNEIHLQTLENANRTYTQQMVERGGKVFSQLVEMNIQAAKVADEKSKLKL
jgi:hypothetical protein